MAMPFFGSLEASLERRWAYSRAVIPGVTANTAGSDQRRVLIVCVFDLTFASFEKVGMGLMHRLAE